MNPDLQKVLIKLDLLDSRMQRVENLLAESEDEDEMEMEVEQFVENPNNAPTITGIALIILGGIPLLGWVFSSIMALFLGNTWLEFGFPVWPSLVLIAGVILVAAWKHHVKQTAQEKR